MISLKYAASKKVEIRRWTNRWYIILCTDNISIATAMTLKTSNGKSVAPQCEPDTQAISQANSKYQYLSFNSANFITITRKINPKIQQSTKKEGTTKLRQLNLGRHFHFHIKQCQKSIIKLQSPAIHSNIMIRMCMLCRYMDIEI